MPGMYADGRYDLAGFAVGAVERDAVLPRSDVQEGDALIALASSGVHSNGYSLVRKVAAQSGLGWDADAPFAQGQSLGEALLTPTKIYVKPVLDAIRATGAIKALAHITGGGLPENLPRVLPGICSAGIDLSAIPVPPVFGWLAATGGIAEPELLRTFNCGVGMVLVVAAARAKAVIANLETAGERAFLLGALEERTGGKAVQFSGALDLAQ